MVVLCNHCKRWYTFLQILRWPWSEGFAVQLHEREEDEIPGEGLQYGHELAASNGRGHHD